MHRIDRIDQSDRGDRIDRSEQIDRTERSDRIDQKISPTIEEHDGLTVMTTTNGRIGKRRPRVNVVAFICLYSFLVLQQLQPVHRMQNVQTEERIRTVCEPKLSHTMP